MLLLQDSGLQRGVESENRHESTKDSTGVAKLPPKS